MLRPRRDLITLFSRIILAGEPFILFFDDAFDFGCALLEHLFHFLRERVRFAQVLPGVVKRLLVGVDRRLVLVQVLVLHCDVVQGDHHHRLAWFVLGLLILAAFAQHQHFVLNQDKCLHCVVQGELVLL